MKEKLSLLTELIKLAKADQEVREEEYMFILSVGQMLGIEEEEISRLFAEHIDFQPPENENQRILQFYRLVLLMNVDQNVNSKELDYVRAAGLKLGLRPQAVEDVLTEMQKDKRGMIPEHVLIAIFRRSRN